MNDIKTEVKLIKHTFTNDERLQLGSDLSNAISRARTLEREFDEVKASWKAKQAEAEARIEGLSQNIGMGFEMRKTKCEVTYRPKDGKKDYRIADQGNPPFGTSAVVLTEDMEPDDYQQELIQSEAKFECKDIVSLFPSTGPDYGLMTVGRLGNRWYAALRIKVGKQSIDERLDAEQKGTKERFDSIGLAAKRASAWLLATLGKDAASGFDDIIRDNVLAQAERVE